MDRQGSQNWCRTHQDQVASISSKYNGKFHESITTPLWVGLNSERYHMYGEMHNSLHTLSQKKNFVEIGFRLQKVKVLSLSTLLYQTVSFFSLSCSILPSPYLSCHLFSPLSPLSLLFLLLFGGLAVRILGMLCIYSTLNYFLQI